MKVSRALASLSLSGALASCTQFSPPPKLAGPARDLGIAARGDACPRSSSAIVDDVIARGAVSAELPADARRDFACLSLRDNLARDEMSGCAPPAAAPFATPLPAHRRVVGDLSYVALDPREYAYDLVPEPDGALGVEVRIAFHGAAAKSPDQIERMAKKLESAAAFWTRHAPGGRMRFRFLAVTSLDHPHYEIELAPGEARTPFDLTWGAEWTWHLIAHEVGHMMGLDDEYEQIRKTLGHALGREPAWRADPRLRLEWLRCDLGSLMCDSKGEEAKPLSHHYYVIARRRFCQRVSVGFPAPF